MEQFFDFCRWWWTHYFDQCRLMIRQIEMEEVRGLRNCWLSTNSKIKDFEKRLIDNGIT